MSMLIKCTCQCCVLLHDESWLWSNIQDLIGHILQLDPGPGYPVWEKHDAQHDEKNKNMPSLSEAKRLQIRGSVQV